MKISLDWLKEYVDVDLPLKELVDRLTMVGLVVTQPLLNAGLTDQIRDLREESK